MAWYFTTPMDDKLSDGEPESETFIYRTGDSIPKQIIPVKLIFENPLAFGEFLMGKTENEYTIYARKCASRHVYGGKICVKT